MHTQSHAHTNIYLFLHTCSCVWGDEASIDWIILLTLSLQIYIV